MTTANILIGAAVAAGLLLAWTNAQGKATDTATDPAIPDGGATSDPYSPTLPDIPALANNADANQAAFLDAISWAEGTTGHGDPYRVCYAYAHTIRDLSDHPAITGEWMGEPLDGLGPQYAGQVSTAAGRYQMRKATWLDAKQGAGLRDFGPASQDTAALWLIKQKGALADVQAGRFDQAVAKVAKVWASLPGANYAGQGMRQLAQLQAVYTASGGYIA